MINQSMWNNPMPIKNNIRTTYCVIRYKKDKRFNCGYNYRTFAYVTDDYDSFEDAKKHMPNDKRYVYAVERTTKYE